MRTATLRLLGCLLLTAAAAGCSARPDGTPIDAATARQLLIDRNWLDVMPQTKDDRLHVYRFVPKMGGAVYQDRTLYRGTFELFVFETTDQQIRFRFPQTGEARNVKFKIDRIKPEGKNGFDLRLTLESSLRGPKVYYSWGPERRDIEARVLPPLVN